MEQLKRHTSTDINNLEIKIKTSLTNYTYLHPKSAIERISLKRQNGGRGLIDIKLLWQEQIHSLRELFYACIKTNYLPTYLQ